EAEVERVRNSLESDVIAGKETVDGYARRLGYYFVQFGDPEYEKKYLEDLLAVDLDEANTAFRDILKKKPVLSLAHPMNHQPDKKRLAAVLNFRPSARPASTERKPLP